MTQLNSDSYRNPLRYQGQDYTYVPLYYRQRDPTTTDIRPKEQNGFYLIGSEWMNTVSGDYWYLASFTTVSNVLQANWVLFGGASGDLLTLSDNAGTIVNPNAAGNIQIAGEIGQKSGTPIATTTAGLNKITINPMATARLIVDQNTGNGTNTTIMGAMALARSGDTIFILPGTYTEDVDMLSGVSLAAYSCDGINGNVVILGRVRLAGNGTCSFSGLQLKTNANYAIELTGNATMNFVDCNIVANNFTAIHVNNAAGQINIDQCVGGNAGNNPFFAIDLGVLEISDSFIGNSSNSATAICTCAGTFNCFTTHFDYPVTTSGSGSLNYYFSRLHTAGSGTTAVTLVGTGGATLEDCVFQTGGGVAITVGAGCNCNLQNNVIDSTASPDAITGAGNINYANNSFVNTSLISTTVQSPNTLRYGIARSTLQPAFSAYVSAAQTNVTGAGGFNYTILFDTKTFDQLTNYTTGSGIFTAPFDGIYFFTWEIYLSSLTVAHNSLLAFLTAGGQVVYSSFLNPSTLINSGLYIHTGSALVSMIVGQQAFVAVQVAGSTQTVNVEGGGLATGPSYFSGYLVC